jgi:hypothetical protein
MKEIEFDIVQPPGFSAETEKDSLTLYWRRKQNTTDIVLWIVLLLIAGFGVRYFAGNWDVETNSPWLTLGVALLLVVASYGLLYGLFRWLYGRATIAVSRYRISAAQRIGDARKFDLADVLSIEPIDRRVLGLFPLSGVAVRERGNQRQRLVLGFTHSAETLFVIQTLQRWLAPDPEPVVQPAAPAKQPASEPQSPVQPPAAPIVTQFDPVVRPAVPVAIVGSDSADFFPLCGIVLGETTIAEIEQIGVDDPLLNVQKGDGNYYEVNATDYWFNIWYHDEDRADSMYIVHTQPVPLPWKELGINWELSYDEWFQLLLDLGFQIKVTRQPAVDQYDGHDTFSAELTATRRGNLSLKITINFNYSHGTQKSDKDTMYNFTIRTF